MKITEIEKKEEEKITYHLHEEEINIICFESGTLILPIVSKSCKLQILFTKKGNFTIDGNGCDVGLGDMFDKNVKTNPGYQGYDTQPTFMFLSGENKWYILTMGMIEFPEPEKPID